MYRRPTPRLALLIAICATLYVPAIHAQLPRLVENCATHPTIAEELRAASHPTLADEIKEAKSHPKIRIDAVTFEGADDLPEPVKAQITGRLKEPVYANDSGWTGYSEDMVRDALRDRGYFFGNVSAKASGLSRDLNEERVAVTLQVSEGRQYRLSEIQFANAHDFALPELRKQIPLQDGGVFTLAGTRRGMEALTRLYGSQGYINLAVSPDIRPDNKNLRISVLLDLDEGRQFRVGSVEVLGLDRSLSGPTLKNKLVPGQIFSSALIEDVFSENKSALPANVSSKDAVEITQDARNATVAIVFYFGPCPQIY
jgi:outer membrane protein assembly factor BamA